MSGAELNGAQLPPAELESLLVDFFCANRTSPPNAKMVARALVRAEIDGKFGHGLSRAAGYAAQARSGKVDGMAQPEISRPKTAAIRIDAANGFAYPAFHRVRENLPPLAKSHGIAAAAICRSHHCGVAGHHAEDLAESGCMALVFANTPPAMAPWGGRTPLFGTNPVAFAAPVLDAPPLVIDLAASTAARGNIVKAARENRPIPQGWALDKDGAPTTDARAALEGSMIPLGGAKGSALALMVETLAGALCGAAFGFEAESFFTAEGAPPNVGQAVIAVSPECFSADSAARLALLIGKIHADGARIPGGNRHARRRQAAEEGIAVRPEILKEISAGG